MKTMPIVVVSALTLLFAGVVGSKLLRAQGQAQGGDQVLDGIGETDLAARYLLDRDAQDRSRNSLHAQVQGDQAAFVDDPQFRRVLSLPGASGNYLEIPPAALATDDTVSVSVWVNVQQVREPQTLFSFGKGPAANFTCVLDNGNEQQGLLARLSADGTQQGPAAPRIANQHWVHLAVVFDSTAKTISLYSDGQRVGRAENVSLRLEQVFDRDNAAANHLYIGRAQVEDGGLNTKLHDLRLYSIALSDEQVATIHRNGAAGGGMAADANRRGRGRGRGNAGRGNRGPVVAPPAAPSPYLNLESVPDVNAETVVGTMPRLPETVSGLYRAGMQGPPVEIIWPAPTDNAEVLQPGTITLTGKIVGSDVKPRAIVSVKAAPAAASGPRRELEPFGLGQVVLNQDLQGRDTPFMQNRDKFLQGLAVSNPDNFLYMFRDAFGQPQPAGARALGGWDTQTTRLRGHATGHYMSALAQAYASTSYDLALHANFKQKMDYMIDTLYELSRQSGKPAEPGGPAIADPTNVPPGEGHAGYDSNLTEDGIRTDYWNWGAGFISAYPPDQFIMLEHGATYGASNNQIWAPYYTLHKILAGLLDCYEVGGNEKALEVAKGMGLWVHARLKQVPAATRIAMWNRYIAGEYGGMNEVLARLYRLTKDERFLAGAKLFDNVNFFYGDAEHDHGLAKNVDTLRDRHANQHIPQTTGALETYRDTGDITYFYIADNFWDLATNHYMYAIGGVAGNQRNGECFTAQPDSLFTNGFANNAQNETCATYNMLKLTRQLFMFEQDAKFMDYYEQALYNHILASVAEDSPGNTYHVPLNPGARKQFGNERMNGFSCCNGTALESNTKLQDSIYFHSEDNDALYVNLYVPSTLNWADRTATVKQETNFPYADTTRLTLAGASGIEVHVRVPDWATSGFFVKINGVEKQVDAKPGTYLSLGKNWKDGDTIELQMPFSFHLSRVMDQPNLASIFYGPVLLAAEESDARTNWRPITLDAKDLSKSLSGDPSTLHFKVGDAELRPFYESYGRYSVYFDTTMK